MSPPIPADVIEEIVDSVHDLGNVRSLRNLALTSHSFLRRSRYHLFSWHICLDSIQKLNSFCDCLDTHPDRRPWVRSVTISSTKESPSFLEVVPVRLLANLPSLEKWRIVTPNKVYHEYDPKQQRWISSNTPKLICLRLYAQAITHLHLKRARFPSCTDFVRYILAFSGLRHLHCQMLKFKHQDDAAALVRARERLCTELQLSHLTIDDVPDVAVTLLLESVRHTLQELVISIMNVTVTNNLGYFQEEFYVNLSTLIPRLSKLHSITLQAHLITMGVDNSDSKITDTSIIQHVANILQALASNPHPLTGITIHISEPYMFNLLTYLRDHSDDLVQTCRTLETAILRFPRLQKIKLFHHLRRPLHTWTPVRLKQFLPPLNKRDRIEIRCLAPRVQGHSGGVEALAVSPDNKRIASGSRDTTIILWDAQHGTVVREWPAHLSAIKSLAFSRDGRYLASVGDDSTVMVWPGDGPVSSAETPTKPIITLEGTDVCVWSLDGTMHASGGRKGTVQVWNPSTNHVRFHSLEGYSEEESWTATFSPDGHWTATCKSPWKVWDATTGRLHKVFPGIADYITLESSVFDPAGRRVAIPSDGHSACIWDVETGDQLTVLEGHTHNICNIAFSPDGTRVLSTGSDDKTVALWDSFGGDTLLSLRGHESMIMGACFSPDGEYVASASHDHTVRLWNIRTTSCIKIFEEHDDWVMCVAFSPDGEILASGGLDGSVCIRRLHDVCPEYLGHA